VTEEEPLSTRDDDRIAYLSGEPIDALTAQERAELDELRELLGSADTWTEPVPELEDRVVAAVVTQAAAAPRAQPARRRWRLPGLAMPRPALGLLAAGVAAVVAVAIAVSVGKSAPSPLHFAMVLAGTPLAPAAHGTAKLTKTASGWRIQLSVTGLPHIENGRYYQAWLKNAGGVLVPVGTFNDGRSVTLWSGVPVTKFRTLSVTVQLANGDPASSGRRVLTGTVHGSGH
jgi:hypothetical protein